MAPDPSDTFAGLDELACATGSECAPTDEEWLADTCCAYGDNLVRENVAYLTEAVDVIANDDFVASCSGFGAGWARHDGDLTGFQLNSMGNGRCQRLEWGPVTPQGQVLYLAHHGDSWVQGPRLWTYLLRNDGTETLVSEEGAFLYEDMAYAEGYLYVAMHDGGVGVHTVDDEGRPTLARQIVGFDNAVDVHVEGNFLYVLDADQLVVVDVTDPVEPVVSSAVGLLQAGRDFDLVDDALYVAVGTDGVQRFDVSTPDSPVDIGVWDLDGTVQSVKANRHRVAVSNWNHVSIVDPVTEKVVATERTVREFEQDLGVALVDDALFVAEWSGVYAYRYRPGYAAPDIWVDQDLLVFPGNSASEAELRVVNRGPLNLVVDETTAPSSLAITPQTFTLEPGEDAFVRVEYTPPHPGGQTRIEWSTNDPDDLDQPRTLRVHADSTDDIDVGDPLNEAFAFLDPTGASELENLEGEVIVLAYFALF